MHKSAFLYLLFTLFSTKSFSQKFLPIETIVKTFPTSFKSPEKLAKQISENFNNDEEKAIAAYIWIASNIKYDVKGYVRGKYNDGEYFTGKTKEEIQKKIEEFKIEIAEKTIKKETGVCENYSQLFQRVCDLMKLNAELVSGYSKNELSDLGKMPSSIDHAWNKVKINNEWKYFDATWGSGYADLRKREFIPAFNYNYCMLNLDRIGLNHIDKTLPRLELAAQRVQFSKTPFYWGSYIASDMTLLDPQTVYVATHGAKTIPFKIKKFPKNAKLTYFLDSGMDSGELDWVSEEGDITQFSLPCNIKVGTIMHIYFDEKPFVSFKIGIR